MGCTGHRALGGAAGGRGGGLGRLLLASGLLLPLASGCWSARRLDAGVARVIGDGQAKTEHVSAHALTDAFRPPAPPAEQAARVELDLPVALRLATRYSRDLQDKREQLYLAGLALLKQRRAFGVDVSSTVKYVFETGSDTANETGSDLAFNASRKLPSGATVTVSADAGLDTTDDPDADADTAYDSSVGVKVEQPLLAGAGYTASHNALIQAERDLVYALRAFAQERQDFAIGIVQAYQNLLIRSAVLENTRRNVEQSVFLRRRSEAMFRVRRAPAIDVMRSQQQELRARNQLASAEADLDIERARFLLTLGIPVDSRITLAGAIPDMQAASLDEAACIEIALKRRLDLATARERRADRERNLRIARQAALPSVSVYGNARLSSDTTESLGEQALENDALSAGVTVEIPLDPREERDAVKKARLSLAAANRQLEEKRDSIIIDVRANFSRLAALGNTVTIELRNTEIAQKRAENALMRFRSGELSNRDVVEAENELLAARNAYVRARADYEIQRLRLLRNIGLLDVAPDGTIVEPPLDTLAR
ncbi:MAG: TolC family protein [Kiritimatiellae bacterium]|nr:TolC family protein [Kiritimatiellia bacterium]